MYTITTKQYGNNILSTVEFKFNISDKNSLIDYAKAVKNGKYGKIYIDTIERITVSKKNGLSTIKLKPISKSLNKQLTQLLGGVIYWAVNRAKYGIKTI